MSIKKIKSMAAFICVIAIIFCLPVSAAQQEPDVQPLALNPVTATEIMHCYSAARAVSYAEEWKDSNNPAYSYYDGVDCANFVSQCLYAGGLETTTDAQTGSGWAPNRTLWTSSSNLRNFLRTVNYATVIDNPAAAQVREGDVIFYRWNNNVESSEYTYHHTAICIQTQGEIRIAHHSYSDGYDTGWNLGQVKRSIARIIRFGDVDFDADVTSTDSRLVLQHAAGKITLSAAALALADIDLDDEITSTDGRLILTASGGTHLT